MWKFNGGGGGAFFARIPPKGPHSFLFKAKKFSKLNGNKILPGIFVGILSYWKLEGGRAGRGGGGGAHSLVPQCLPASYVTDTLFGVILGAWL